MPFEKSCTINFGIKDKLKHQMKHSNKKYLYFQSKKIINQSERKQDENQNK